VDAPVRLETERLVLRPPAAEDRAAWTAFLADARAARFIGGVQGRHGAWRNLAMMVGAWELDGYGMFSVIEKASGRWIGRIGPWRPEGWPGPEIGWALDPRFWGRGYATEAARASMGWARDRLGWRRVIHLVHPDNTPSLALARRLGSVPLAGYDTSVVSADQPLLVYGRDLVAGDGGASRAQPSTSSGATSS
jgi:RimJ/RimL family protein N-acetyltransferase